MLFGIVLLIITIMTIYSINQRNVNYYLKARLNQIMVVSVAYNLCNSLNEDPNNSWRYYNHDFGNHIIILKDYDETDALKFHISEGNFIVKYLTKSHTLNISISKSEPYKIVKMEFDHE